jgi:hypothetical protein
MHKEVVKEIEAIDSLLIAGVTEKEVQTFFAVIDKVKANLTAKE